MTIEAEIAMAIEQVKQKLAEKDDRIATLEVEVARLRELLVEAVDDLDTARSLLNDVDHGRVQKYLNYTVNKVLKFREALATRQEATCEHCGGHNIITDCPRCGAPVCCKDCCEKDWKEYFATRQEEEGK